MTINIVVGREIARDYGAKSKLSTYITLDQQRRHETGPNNHNVASLNQQLSRCLDTTTRMLQRQSVGITSSDSLVVNEEQQDVFSGINFNFRQCEFQKQANHLTRVRQLLNNNDIHLSLPDVSAYNLSLIHFSDPTRPY